MRVGADGASTGGPATIAAAYDATAERWEHGPGRVYNRLAERVVVCSPVTLAGRRVLDLGAGMGAGSRAISAAGAEPVALDGAFGMLAAAGLPHRVQGDALDLPFRNGGLDGVVAAFSLNHVHDPVRAMREAARVTAPGGPLLIATYATDDSHPAKTATEEALRAVGWEPEPWYQRLKHEVIPLLATPDRGLAAAGQAGLDASCHELRVPFPHLTAEDLVAWRFGMAQHAPFVAGLGPAELEQVRTDALRRLGDDFDVLVRSIIVLSAIA